MELSAGYKRTELGVIPQQWGVKPLGEIGSVLMCKRVLKHQTHERGDVPFYKIGTFGGVADAFIPQSLYDEFRRKYSFPRKGDVLISAAGTIGRTVIYDGAPAYFQDSNIVWIDNDESTVTNAFLWHRYQVTKWSVSHGGTVARLYNENIRADIHIPVPAIPEQRAIATALSDVDALLAKIDQIIAKKRDLKQAAMQQLLTGQTRLPGFSGEWEVKRLGDLLSYEQPTPYLVKSAEYDNGNSVPVLTAGKTFILGYTNETEGVYLSPPVIIFDDFTTASKFVDFTFKAKSSAMKILKAREGCAHIRFAFERMQIIDFQLGDHKRYWISEYSKLPIETPSLVEQTAIATVLSDMDAELAALEARRDKTRGLKQGMMQALLTGRIRLVGGN